MSAAPPDTPASHAEIIAALNELLEAERAGAHVALASARLDHGGDYRALMRLVRADEAHWCAMLRGQIERLGGTPSRRTGAFREKALAIGDPVERLRFLNRGQTWVARRLEALLPRLDDAALRRDLDEMRASHHINIARTEDVIAADGARDGRP